MFVFKLFKEANFSTVYATRFYCQFVLSNQLNINENINLFLKKKSINKLIFTPRYLKFYKDEIKYDENDTYNVKIENLIQFLNENPVMLKEGIHYLNSGKPVYGRYQNNFVQFDKNYNRNCFKHILANLNETKFIIDFSYNLYMVEVEKNELIQHLSKLLKINHFFKLPFSIAFTNLNKNSEFYSRLLKWKKRVPCIIDIHENSYCDLYPTEKLIYLSPHAEEELTDYDPSYYYIVGALVDKSFSKKLSYEKAKLEQIKAYKLPIDDYLNKYARDKNKLLPIYKVIQILLFLKNYYSLEKAIEISLKDRLGQKLKKIF